MNNYATPPKYYVPLHHPRSRFKNNVENVLSYISTSVAMIGKTEADTFKKSLDVELKKFENNAEKTQKTIDNWRTEITALFCLFNEKDEVIYPMNMALDLANETNLQLFFRRFVSTFQYPGGHQKAHKIIECVKYEVMFHPAQWICRLLLYLEEKSQSEAYLRDIEFCHCAMNDLRVTGGSEDIVISASRILNNRNQGAQYDSRGDVKRSAMDILDYMELAGILRKDFEGKYRIPPQASLIAREIGDDDRCFDSYGSCRDLGEAEGLKHSWINYVNDAAKYCPATILLPPELDLPTETGEPSSGVGNQVNTKLIGDVGEGIALIHEKNRMEMAGRGDLVHLIKKIPNELAVGYDINSFQPNGNRIMIEVKTTASQKKLTFNHFHLTTNEWKTAETYRAGYYVYRIQLEGSEKTERLLTLQNPVGLYKNDKINMTPRDGADINFDLEFGCFEEILK